MVEIIGACLGFGAQVRGCEEGPEYLQRVFVKKQMEKKKFLEIPWKMLYPEM